MYKGDSAIAGAFFFHSSARFVNSNTFITLVYYMLFVNMVENRMSLLVYFLKKKFFVNT